MLNAKLRKLGFAVASVALLSACGKGFDAGSGDQIGNVSRLTREGLWCPTWEGEIAAINNRSRKYVPIWCMGRLSAWPDQAANF